MTMNTVFNLSDAGRTFAIDIAGSPNQAMLRSSAYTVKVAYSALSQTIHSIGKRGGKVVNVRMPGGFGCSRANESCSHTASD
jgi:CpcD/allophycocyanin linker domain